jgi:hypothetical protein
MICINHELKYKFLEMYSIAYYTSMLGSAFVSLHFRQRNRNGSEVQARASSKLRRKYASAKLRLWSFLSSAASASPEAGKLPLRGNPNLN